MGKYSTPAQFAGQKKKASGEGYPQKKVYPPLNWALVDVIAQMEFHTSIRPFKDGNTWRGRCPFPGCSSQHDALTIWPNLSKDGNHYYCRQCKKAGKLTRMLDELYGWPFPEILVKIGLTSETELDAAALTRMSAARQEEMRRAKFFKEQLEVLRGFYPYARQAIEQYERPIAYNASRGVSVEDARAYGLGYIPHVQELRHVDQDALKKAGDLLRWQGRIIFPLQAPGDEGLTFAGRTLALWKPGMSPAEHKAVIAAYNAALAPGKKPIERVIKTSPCGYFGYSEAAHLLEIVCCEGEYDALSLLIAGVVGVIATGVSFPASIIPFSLEHVTLAMDGDEAGKVAGRELALDLAKVGIETRQVLPVGKDWNDMFVAGRAEEIRGLFASALLPEQIIPAVKIDNVTLEEVRQVLPEQDIEEPSHFCFCGAEVDYYSEDGIAFCVQHWPGVIRACEDEDIDNVNTLAEQITELKMIPDSANGLPLDTQEEVQAGEPLDNIKTLPEQITASRELTPEEIGAIVARTFTDWNIEVVPGQPVKTVEPSIAGAGDFWAYVERQNARPPLNKQGRPMMSRERWAKIRAEQLAWRPNPKLLAHRSSNV